MDNISQSTLDFNENSPENYYKIYPDLSHDIFYTHGNTKNERYVNRSPVAPTAPPLPSSDSIDFSNI